MGPDGDGQDDMVPLLTADNDGAIAAAQAALQLNTPAPMPLPTCKSVVDDEMGDAIEYVTLSSYGGDFDFYGTSDKDVPYGAHPIFTRRVLLFFVTTFLIRPACCGAFLTYSRFTGDQVLAILGIAVTVSFYALLALHAYIIRRNVIADRMPLNKTQVVVMGLLSACGPVAFVATAYVQTFNRREFFDRVLAATTTQDADVSAAETLTLVTCLTMLANLVYAIICIGDALGFILPRLWVGAVMKTYVPF
ncbi:envelope protein UL20 [Columbid alphaherpesvirus 1]|uniref:Envelope protein UL20 n=1 Tax=Columbid alphaherpesvirus 1 TaxID=93386 RepID=A0A1V0M8F9_9ALPH|nr:envelope protein UL20 [Columbid alphaherpesvirus 1]ARD71343.1 envelope protein UL20 [Columbid alphaherpesvirus 1]